MPTDLHYLTYDPNELWETIMSAYVEAGGEPLWPGDEKDMLLRAVQAVLLQAFATVDTALRQATLRYATGEYLDLQGEKRQCSRIQAAASVAEVEVSFLDTGKPETLLAGTELTADGTVIWALQSDLQYTGAATTVRCGIACTSPGAGGNGLREGAMMQFVNTRACVASVKVVTSASGGMDAEDDETYRARIQKYGLGNVTTGPSGQYESKSMAASSEVLDARALNLGAGKVGVYLILDKGANAENVKKLVEDAVNPRDVRPLTDEVTVEEAEKVAYTIKAEYAAAESGATNIEADLKAAVAEYQDWQDNTIGRAFNPDRLMAMLYQAGANRVRWGADSHFQESDPVQYTEIGEKQRCFGSIELGVISE